jgi:type IX secretion system PorP/SprF family membrane protein
MFASETYNPAAMVRNDMFSVFGLYRMQWLLMPNAPQTMFFAANAPFNLFKKQHSAGIIFSNDRAGIFSNQQVALQYAYKQKIGEVQLSVGANIGFVSQTIDGTKIGFRGDNDSIGTATSDYHNIAGDPLLPITEVNGVGFDMGLGANIVYKNFYAGISLLHLFEPKLNMDDYVESFIGRVMYLDGGYNYTFENPKYKLKPRALIKTDFVSWQMDLNLLLEINEKYWAGIGWRLQDAVVFTLGINVIDALSIGYSFDLATTKLIAHTAGSHELFLRYDFNFGKKKTNRYKSVRIL